jgi:hypothetical protein
MVVWEKMKWELERGGWVAGNGDLESIERVERREALGRYWDKFGCYLLLESFRAQEDGRQRCTHLWFQAHQQDYNQMGEQTIWSSTTVTIEF